MAKTKMTKTTTTQPEYIKGSFYERSMLLMASVMLMSEIWKQWTLTEQVYKGVYNVWYVPFQLCSLPMYLGLMMWFVSEAWKRRIQVFLMTFSLLGGVAAFCDTSGMQYSLTSLTWHSYLWHMVIIVMGIWSGFDWCRRNEAMIIKPVAPEELREITETKIKGEDGSTENHQKTSEWEFLTCLPIWLISILIATALNVVLWPYGEINMFYISPMEASSQVFIHEIAMKYGIAASNLIYLAAMLAGAFILYEIWNRIVKKN